MTATDRGGCTATRHVGAAGVELAMHRRSGSGRPLVMLHGFTGSTRAMTPLLTALAPTADLVGVDLVGHGESAAPDDISTYRMDAVVRQVLAVIDSLGGDPVDLLGYSMGGRTALAVAVADPGKVAGLFLIGASAGLADATERRARRRADEALADRIERDGLDWFVPHWEALPLFASQARLGAAERAHQHHVRRANRPRGLANSLRGMGTGAMAPLHDRLGRVACPTAVIVGAEDAKFLGIGTELTAALPGAVLHPIPQAGHAAHLEAPAAVAQVIERLRP